MKTLDSYLDGATAPTNALNIASLVIGLVTNNQDPQNLGRVKLKFPFWSDTEESDWARLAVLMGGADRGIYALPEVNDEVLVAFAHGDIRYPYVLGALWNGQDKPPATNEDGQNDLRLIKSRSGHLISFNDKAGEEVLEIKSKQGHTITIDNAGIKVQDEDEQTVITLDAGNKTVTITAQKDLKLAAPNGALSIMAKTIELSGTASTTIKSSGVLECKGSLVKIN